MAAVVTMEIARQVIRHDMLAVLGVVTPAVTPTKVLAERTALTLATLRDEQNGVL